MLGQQNDQVSYGPQGKVKEATQVRACMARVRQSLSRPRAPDLSGIGWSGCLGFHFT